jgi:hypothetical protein
MRRQDRKVDNFQCQTSMPYSPCGVQCEMRRIADFRFALPYEDPAMQLLPLTETSGHNETHSRRGLQAPWLSPVEPCKYPVHPPVPAPQQGCLA